MKAIFIYLNKIIQTSIPFASIVWTVNFQFSYRSICSFVVKELIFNKVYVISRLIVTFSANGQFWIIRISCLYF